jgi:hypothetical protein
MAIKACFMDGFQGHGTLGNAVLSTLNKAAANGHRNEIKIDKLAKQLGCSEVELRACLSRLQTEGRIATNTLLNWSEIGSIQLAEPIIACEPAQLSLGERDDDPDTVAISLDALTHLNDVDIVVDGRHRRFALRYSDDGDQVFLTVSEAASAKAKKRDALVDSMPFPNKAEAIKWAKEYAGEFSGGD